MGLFTFLNTSEIKAQNSELQKQLEILTSKLDTLLQRLSQVEAEVEAIKASKGLPPKT